MDPFLNAVGNYFIVGPNSNPHAGGEFKATDYVFQNNNFADTDQDGKLNGRERLPNDFGTGENAPAFETYCTVAPLTNVILESAATALISGRAQAGLRNFAMPWIRD